MSSILRAALPVMALKLAVALLLGSAIVASERQWNQKIYGCEPTPWWRWARGFVVAFRAWSARAIRSRVAGQVVTGIGFLGAGVILREGINARAEHGGDAVVLGHGRHPGRRRTVRPGAGGSLRDRRQLARRPIVMAQPPPAHRDRRGKPGIVVSRSPAAAARRRRCARAAAGADQAGSACAE